MKNTIATTALVLVAALGATSGFAADSSPRVRLNNTDTSSFFAKTAPSVLSRSEVQSQWATAAKSGNLPAMGEGYTARSASEVSTLTRAAVKADYLQAQKTGTLLPMGDRG